MITASEAVNTLYTVAGNEPYKTTTSWTRTQEFKLDTIHSKQINQFVIDERFAVPDSKHTSKQTPL